MTFNPLIPQPGDLISVSQGELLINFGQLNAQYGADHDGFNTGSANGSGMHDQVTFLANQAAPSLTRNSVAGVSGIYCNLVGGVSCLFFQNSTQNIQLTGTTTASDNGSTVLPGGIIMKWGNFGFNGGSGSAGVSFGTAFPNHFYSCSLLPSTGTPSAGVGSVSFSGTGSLSGFTAFRSNTSGVVTYFYIAIGN